MTTGPDLHLDRVGEARLHTALRRCWQPVCRVSELGERPIPVTLLDEQIARFEERLAMSTVPRMSAAK